MHAEPLQVLRASQRPGFARHKPRLLIVGATGVLGNEVLGRLVGLGRFEGTQVLTREPITAGLRGVGTTVVQGDLPEAWSPAAAEVAVILFDPPRLFYDRERALWTPRPDQLPALAAWLRRSGTHTVAVVLPHAQGRLPDALKRGLASMDEHAVVALGFDRVLIVRSAQKPAAEPSRGWLPGVAGWMLSSLKYMVPASEQPVRAAKVAEFVALALQLAPPGIHVAAPETVWRAAQGDLRTEIRRWLGA
jgi:hypothetical protein